MTLIQDSNQIYLSTVNIAGIYLIVEGLASIFCSADKRELSQIGRIGRVVIGVYLLGCTGGAKINV